MHLKYQYISCMNNVIHYIILKHSYREEKNKMVLVKTNSTLIRKDTRKAEQFNYHKSKLG